MSNLTDFVGGLPPKWVTGTTYADGAVVFSPSDNNYYMRKSGTAGAGSTDPSSDGTNWQPTGDRAIKSIQRGTISMVTAASGTATITSVNTAKTELRFLGMTSDQPTNFDTFAKIVLTNATTVTATRAATAGTVVVSFELTERY